MPAPTMEVNAKAVWNEEKEKWEVTVHLFEDNLVSLEDGSLFSLTLDEKVEIACCDEFVIPMAILDTQGLDTTSIAEALELNKM